MISDDSSAKLAECDLSQFTEALIRGNGFGHESLYIKRLFGAEPFAIVEETLDQYTHNICQYSMAEFFTSKGFSKSRETFYDEGGEVAVTYESLEYAPNQHKKVYKNAFVIFDKDAEKVCVSINKFGNREIVYRLYAGTGKENTMVDWMEYARKNNLYKGKKISADCRFLELKDVTWNDIILEPKTIKVVQEQVNELFEFSEYLKANKINIKRGVILAGPPGCVIGKTKIKIRKVSDKGKYNIHVV